MDREKVIKGLEECVGDGYCTKCQYGEGRQVLSCRNLLNDARVLLKEQEETIKELQNAYGYLQKQFFEAQDKLLKEQEAVKPTWGRGKPFCGACGLQIRGGKFCSECGKPIAWEGR